MSAEPSKSVTVGPRLPGETDDTPRVQRAVNEAAGVVEFPPDTYYVSNVVLPPIHRVRYVERSGHRWRGYCVCGFTTASRRSAAIAREALDAHIAEANDVS